ncbi:hypothetical protein T07_8291 [Trichinella nelsoni]|uniref:Uncharacterized protein n=1 Tax=Trichinella nelsoni TaxID=6336 RepID=A0A0V0SCG8_9BILA|nr:hypothetical protein T07_8291 [Trichinella nelsoni]
MSAIIKAFPHIADETANTKKQTDANCELIENQQPSTTAANALVNPASAHIRPYITRISLLFRAADTVVFVVVVEVFCSTHIITKAINKRIRSRFKQ